MRIRFDPTPLKESRPSGHALRFAIGGAVTAATGGVAKLWGPKVGGLLLALPAILPIGVALIAKLQNRKAGPGARGDRGRRAAVVEATGASAAAIGLIGFAVVAWRLLIRWPSWLALAMATTAWVGITLIVWLARKTPRRP